MAADGTIDTIEERVTDATQTVQSEAKDLAGKAKTEAQSALRQVVDDAKAQADEQSSKLAESLRHSGEDMRAMADATDDGSLPATFVREGARIADRLASSLDRGGIDGALAEVRSFARRSPGVFLFGAAAAGFVMGRVVRNVSADDIKELAQGSPSNGSPSMPGLDLDAAGVVEGSARSANLNGGAA
jgi:hypothetical protein